MKTIFTLKKCFLREWTTGQTTERCVRRPAWNETPSRLSWNLKCQRYQYKVLVIIFHFILSFTSFFFFSRITFSDYGPGDWGKMAPLCSRQHQSPIDINISAAKTEKSYRGLVLNVEQNVGGAVTGSLINNGHVPTFHVNNKKGAVTLNGGPLGKILHILHQFHFHFGCNSSVGSEHRVDGKHFAAEVNDW